MHLYVIYVLLTVVSARLLFPDMQTLLFVREKRTSSGKRPLAPRLPSDPPTRDKETIEIRVRSHITARILCNRFLSDFLFDFEYRHRLGITRARVKFMSARTDRPSTRRAMTAIIKSIVNSTSSGPVSFPLGRMRTR